MKEFIHIGQRLVLLVVVWILSFISMDIVIYSYLSIH